MHPHFDESAPPPAPNTDRPAAPSRAQRVVASLNTGSLGVSIGFAFTAAALLNPVFSTPFLVLLGRTLFVSMLLLLVFVGTQRLPQRWLPGWLPRWLFTVVSVGLAAPLGTLLVYLFAVGGRAGEFFASEPRVWGFFIIASTALVLGLLITLTAQLREREARARTQALEFELERSRLERQAVDARLALLQAQIEPHFLFNTLANVQALVESGSPRAADVLKSLIAYLRAAVPRLHRGDPTVADELALVRAYLELMQMRMPDRLQFNFDVAPAAAHLRFPAMALLTLVENAVRHGIDPSETGGRIDVGVRVDGRHLQAWVQDDGIGLSVQAKPGIGLRNLRERLTATYGAGATLELLENSPRGLRAKFTLPLPP
jgi:hypothetical protein